MEIDHREHSAPWHLPLLLSVVLLNICLPSLVLSYGTILVYYVNHGLPTWVALCTPAIIILTYCLSQCWCREAADSWGGNVGYRLLSALGLLLVVSSLFACAFIPSHLHPLIYGILAGLGSSLISAQVDAVVFETYDSKLGVIRGLSFAGQALGLSIFPHIITALIDSYGFPLFHMVFSGIMVQIYPALLFLKEYGVSRPLSYSRYSDLAKTYAMLSNDFTNNIYGNELQLQDLSKKSWKSPSDDNLTSEDETDDWLTDCDGTNAATITPPPSPEEKRKNIFGVEIMPEIPEESEDSDNSEDQNTSPNRSKKKKRFSTAIKRLSTMSDNFNESIANQTRRDSLISDSRSDSRDYSELSVTYDHIAPITEIERERVLNSFSFRCQSAYASFKRKLWMPSYRIYRLRRRSLYLMYSLNDTFIKPLTRSLSCWRFYPALILCFSRLSLSAVSLALLPIIDLQIKPAISMFETNFMMSLHGFTWICFLLSTPWLVHTARRNFKYILVCGLFMSAGACFVIAKAKTHDTFSIGCVIAGIGFGITNSCWETTVQDFVGARKWPKIHSTLETLSGLFLAAYVFGLSYVVEEEGGKQFCIFILGVTLATVSVIWTILACVALYIERCKSIQIRQKCFF